MILLCPQEKSAHFHYPLDPKKIHAEGSMHKDTTYHDLKSALNENVESASEGSRVLGNPCGANASNLPGMFTNCNQLAPVAQWTSVLDF